MALVATLTEAQPSSPSWPAVSREMKPGSRWWWMGSAVDEQNLKRNMTEYDGSEAVMTLELPGRSQFYVYRMMQLYRPKAGSSAVNAPLLKPAAASDGFYTLQGLRVSHPRRGLYLRKGRKVLLVP